MGLGAGLLSTGTTYAGLYLDTSTSRLFAVLDTGQAAALGCRVGQTLCAAALEACCSRELVLPKTRRSAPAFRRGVKRRSACCGQVGRLWL